MAEADAEDRLAARDQCLDHRHGVSAGGGRIARPIREKNPVGLVAQNVLGGRGRRHDGDGAAFRRQHSEDVSLGAVIDGDDPMPRLGELAIALGLNPAGLVQHSSGGR